MRRVTQNRMEGKIGRVPKEKMEKQSNAWAAH